MGTALLAGGMRSPGIIETIQLAVVLAFAAPLMFFGVEWLLQGRLLGTVFVFLGVVMLLLERYLTNPFDPGDLLERVLRDEE